MKKALFATTALVAFAGAAAAEVTISGSAEMGIIGGDRTWQYGSPTATQYWNDVDIKFTLSGESDSGLSFGAVVDLDEAGNLGNEEGNQGTSVFISGAFGTLTLGDTDGALDWALQEADIGNPGSISDDETTHIGFLGGYGDGGWDNQVLRYNHTFGDFGVAISYEQAGLVGFVGIPPGWVPDVPGWSDGSLALGLKYGMDLGGNTINLGLGYQTTDYLTATDESIVGVSVSGEFGGGFSAALQYSAWSDVGGTAGFDVDHVGIGGSYSSGPITVHANWGQFSPTGGGNFSGFGLAGAYDFGGGLSLNLGVGSNNYPAPFASDTFWSLGMVMSF